MPPDVAVVIVNYSTPEMAIAAADSVLHRGEDGLSVEVHVVDNGSPGNDREVLSEAAARWGGAVTLHLEDENHGFGRGNNIVLRELAARSQPPDKVFLLNPDTRLISNAVAELAAFLDAHPDVAVVGGGIVDDITLEHAACAFRFPGVISEFNESLNFGPLWRLLKRWNVTFPAGSSPFEVDWVSGAAMMARLSALKEVGFFDPDYFLYFEEVDLMFRLKKRGWKVWHLPQAKVSHVAGASTGVRYVNPERPPLPGYWFDSWRFYFEKTRSRNGARIAAFSRLAGTVLGNLLCSLRNKPTKNPQNFASEFRRRVVRPLFGLTSTRPEP